MDQLLVGVIRVIRDSGGCDVIFGNVHIRELHCAENGMPPLFDELMNSLIDDFQPRTASETALIETRP